MEESPEALGKLNWRGSKYLVMWSTMIPGPAEMLRNRNLDIFMLKHPFMSTVLPSPKKLKKHLTNWLLKAQINSFSPSPMASLPSEMVWSSDWPGNVVTHCSDPPSVMSVLFRAAPGQLWAESPKPWAWGRDCLSWGALTCPKVEQPASSHGFCSCKSQAPGASWGTPLQL